MHRRTVSMDDTSNAKTEATSVESPAFYVYAHRDSGGAIFYIGKGTGKRAWSLERHPIWHRYVQERLKGIYSVEILERGLTEIKAEEREGELITQLGPQLVNWQNPGRGFDYAALEKYHALRGANLLFVASTRPMEISDINNAIGRYKQALDNLRQYERLVVERGVVAELSTGLKIGDLMILGRLTLCLVRSNRCAEARAEAEGYFEEFPRARDTTAGQRILKRVLPRASEKDTDNSAPSTSPAGMRSRSKIAGRFEQPPMPRRTDIAVPPDPVDRNIEGHALERDGLIENAVDFYQANVRDGFEGSFPYDRLAVIFRKRGDVGSEIVVLKRAIEVFSALCNSPRTDVSPKLARFMTRLAVAERLTENGK
jgi:hypothetical protein